VFTCQHPWHFVRLDVWHCGPLLVVYAPCKRGVGTKLIVAGFAIVFRSAQDVRPWGVWIFQDVVDIGASAHFHMCNAIAGLRTVSIARNASTIHKHAGSKHDVTRRRQSPAAVCQFQQQYARRLHVAYRNQRNQHARQQKVWPRRAVRSQHLHFKAYVQLDLMAEGHGISRWSGSFVVICY
jgi:hypothetical protein